MSTRQGSWMMPLASADSTHQTSGFSDTRRWMRHVRRRNTRTKFVSTVDEDIALRCECGHYYCGADTDYCGADTDYCGADTDYCGADTDYCGADTDYCGMDTGYCG